MKTKEHYQFDTDRIRAISITAVARKLGFKVRRVGVNHVTLCPWHDDHDPSLWLVEGTDKNFCKCFSCGKGGDVIKFVRESEGWSFQDARQWLSNEFGISTIKGPQPVLKPKPSRKQQETEEPKYAFIPTEMLDKLVSTENSLCQCMMRLFHPEAVKAVVEEYRLGCYSLFGSDIYTVFPTIDIDGRVKNLKVQLYETDITAPRFAKSVKKAYWLGKMWVRDGLLPKDTEYNSKGLFGEHLLNQYPDQTIALVESPKNAIVGALEHPELLWLATGNKTALQRKLLEPLRERNVIVIPDRDAIELWRKSIQSMSDMANFTVSDYCEHVAPDDQPKYDIADYIISKRLRAFFEREGHS